MPASNRYDLKEESVGLLSQPPECASVHPPRPRSPEPCPADSRDGAPGAGKNLPELPDPPARLALELAAVHQPRAESAGPGERGRAL
jgi:hypothetical protein